MAEWIEYAFIFACGSLSFSILYSLSRIYVYEERWIKKYFEKKKELQHLHASFPSLLLQLSSFLKSGYALSQGLQHLSKSTEGKWLCLSLKCRPSILPSSSHFSLFLRFLGASISASQKNGISLSPILKKISQLSRDDLNFQEKIKVLTFPIRAQSTIAILLPWFVIVIFSILDADLILNAFSHTSGIVGFSTAFFMEIAALAWMRKILT